MTVTSHRLIIEDGASSVEMTTQVNTGKIQRGREMVSFLTWITTMLPWLPEVFNCIKKSLISQGKFIRGGLGLISRTLRNPIDILSIPTFVSPISLFSVF